MAAVVLALELRKSLHHLLLGVGIEVLANAIDGAQNRARQHADPV
jgi:hypothetical protein